MRNFQNIQEDPQEKELLSSVNILISSLGSNFPRERENARKALLKLGRPAIDYLAKLVFTREAILRWEAVKTLAEIQDPLAAPLLIGALEDKLSSIRWLAAEGLICLGKEALKPLLKALIAHPGSVFIQVGVQHVLCELNKRSLIKHVDTLLSALENNAAVDQIHLAAEKIWEILND